MTYEEIRKKYVTKSRSNPNVKVDKNYIDSFFSEANKFSADATAASKKVGYENAPAYLEYYKSRLSDLRDRAKNIKAYLYDNRSSYGEGEHEKLVSDIDNILSGHQSAVDWFAGLVGAEKTDQKDKDTFFQKGVFEDGWQFGDVFRAVGATLGDLGENALKGLGEFAEGVWDWIQARTAKDKTSASIQARNELAKEALEKGKLPSASYSEVSKRTEKIVKNNKNEAAKKIAKDSIQTDKIDFGVDEYSLLGEKSDELVQSAASVAARIGMSAIPVVGTGLSIATTGTSVAGSEIENAIRQGASFDDAYNSGLISAGAELLSEQLFGGIKFGGKAITEITTSKIASTISNKTIGTLAKWGFDTVGEGAEEVISGFLSAVGQKLTYASDKKINELFSSEDAWDNFVGGAILGGFFDGVNIGISKVKGIDYITGLSNKEKAVVDKVYQDKVAEKEKATGKKLNTKEKTEIFDSVITEAENGYISNTIESDIAKMQTATEARLTELGEAGDVSSIAEAIVKQASGESLTRSEKALLQNSKYGQRVSNEISPSNVGSGEYSNAWAESIGTELVNSEEYNLAIESVQNDDATQKALLDVAKTMQDSTDEGITATETNSSPTKENIVESEYEVSADGKTINKKNDKIANVKNIESISADGEANLTLDDGMVVKASDLAYGNNAEAIFIENIGKMKLGRLAFVVFFIVIFSIFTWRKICVERNFNVCIIIII